MNSPLLRQQKGLIALGLIVTVLVTLTVFRKTLLASSPPIVLREAQASPPVGEQNSASAPAPDASPTPPTMASGALPAPEIVVHIVGAVQKPGVYHLPMGSRGEDALKAAGGARAEANPDALNLAEPLQDGAQLYVPTRKEKPESLAQAAYKAGDTPMVAPHPAVRPTTAAAGTAKRGKTAAKGGGKNGKLTAPGQGTVNLNTASTAELQRLPGVGPAMAERILAFRQESGRFQSPEDLLSVSGIGPKKFERMRPFLRVK